MKTKRKGHAKRRAPVVEALEPRILLSADLPGFDILVGDSNDSSANDVEQLISMALAGPGVDEPSDALPAERIATDALHCELVIVDPQVSGYQQLIADLTARGTNGTLIESVVLDPQRGGVDQISEILASRSDLDAIHLISHGSDGAIQVGGDTLDLAAVQQHEEAVRTWGGALSDQGDLLIYGCDLAATETGQALVDTLAGLTGADVAASEDLTGHANRGGDWDLEYRSGDVETDVAFGIDAQDAWDEVLAVTVDTSSSGFVTDADTNPGLVTVSHTTSAGTNRLMLVGVSMEPEGETVTSVSYNGSGMTLIGVEEDSGGKARVEIWGLVNPDSGTHDVVVNLPGTVHKGVVVGATTFTGVNQTNPWLGFNGESGKSATASVTLSSATDDLVFAVVQSLKGTSALPDAGQAEQWDIDAQDANGSGTVEAGATSVTSSWTVIDDVWSAAAVSVQADTNSAESATLSSVQDAYIQLQNPATNDGTSGAMVIDREDGDKQRALVQFELSAIPAGATIQSATLKLEASAGDQTMTIAAYQLLESWDEGSVTWDDRSAGTPWGSGGGGTFVGTALDSFINDAIGVHSFDVTTLAQDWIDGAEQNYGILIGVPDTGGDRTVTYDTREGTVAPQLEIIYTPVANDPPTLSLNNVVASLPEDTDTTSAIKIADIAITDDGTGTNDLSLTGADQTSFEIVSNELRLKAGAVLDFENNPTLDVTVQVDDGTVGSTPDDSVPVALSITDANDAPVLDNSGAMTLTSIFEDQYDSTGTLVSDIIASAGDQITDQDGDAEGIAITAVDESNGTWQYSTDGGSNWSDVGTVSDSGARLVAATDLLRFVPDTAFNGTAGISFRAWDTTAGSSGDGGVDVMTNGGSSAYSTATESATITVAPVDIKLYFSTVDTQVGAGTPGADSWARGDVIAIGDPGFALEADGAKDGSAESSGGTLYNSTQGYLNTANTANSDTIGDVRISAMHYVGEDVTVGSNTTFDPLAGDLLLSVAHSSATFQGSSGPALTVGSGDVFVFRPDTPGDYRSGTFELLFNDPDGGGNLTGIALAETTVVVGTGGGKTTLQPGTLVYSTDNAVENNIYFYEPDNVGTVTTPMTGGTGTLVDGDEVGLGVSGASGNPITGLSLIKQNVVVDGVTLDEGTLLVSLDKNDGAVGNSSGTAAGDKNDVYALAVSSTEAAGGTTAEATLLYDGSDLGLNTNGEGFSAFTVLIDTTGGKQDPNINLGGGTLAFTEDDGATVLAPGANVNDTDSPDFAGGQLRVEFTANGTANDRLSVQNQGSGAGQVGLVNELVQYEGVTVGNLSGGVGALPLVITFNSNASDTIVGAVVRAVTYDNVSGSPSELTRTVQFQVTDGDGGTSAQRTKDITVTAVADNPVITSVATASVVENSTAVMTVTASDPDLDTPTYHITGGADAAFFAIDSGSGALSFRDAPDFEGPADADGNNTYLVEVSARDGNGNAGSLLITVSVSDVNEVPVVADWYNADWQYRKAVTVDAANVAGSLRDFPVLVSIAADADLVARALANGDDILFTSADGSTKLAHEIESFDSATGELRVWVKTDLSAGQDTVLYLYYGNATATSQQDPTNVWDGNFVGVWHLDEAPDGDAGLGTNEILDSTANTQHGNTEGGINASDLVSAKIGEGIDFDSVDASLIRIANSAVLDSTAPNGTFELWVNFVDAADLNHQIIMTSSNRYDSSPNDGFEWASQGDGDHFFYPWGGDGNNYNLGPNPFTNLQWHHLAVSFDYEQRDASIFVDGVEMTYDDENVPALWTTLADPDEWLWGGNPDRNSRYFDGLMDEIRVSNVDRSLAWIQTSFVNQNAAAAFASIGAEQSRGLAVAEDAANDTTVGFAYGFDDDGDALTYSLAGGNVGNAFKINAGTGEIQVNDANAIDYETLNSYFLAVRATDPDGESDLATVRIDVTGVNDHAPVAIANSYTLNEGALESGNIITEDTGTGVDSDADLPGDTLSIASVNGTAWAGLTDSSHATYTAGLGYKEVNTANGVVYIHQDGTTHYQHDDSETTSDSFTYTLSDGLNSSAAATVSYTISPQNDHAPVAIANSYTLNEGALESGNIITEDTGTGVDSDADLPGDTLSIASVNGTAWAGLTDSSHATYTAGLGYKEVNTANGVVYIHQDGTTHYQHDDSETTSDSFTYTLSDGLNSSAAATVSYTISPQNDHAPVAIANSYTLNEGALESGNIITEDTGTGVDSDADLPGDTLSIASVNGTAWAGLTDSSHATYTAGLGYKEVNTANGVVYIHQDGTTHYQHDDSETTSDSFTYTLSDGLNSSAAATVSYTISPQNDHAPVAIANSYTLNEGALESGNIITEDTGTGVDSDADLPGDTLSIASVNGTAWAGLTDSSHATYTAGLGYKEVNTANGVVYIHQDGTTHYQHDDSETTSDSFTYTLSDGLNSSAAATVSYTISPQNDHAPVAIANSYTLNEGALESGNIITEDTGTGVDSDADLPGDTLSIASVNGTAWAGLTDSSHATYTAGLGYKEVNTANGVVYIHQDGTTHYQHDDSETTSDSFTYTLSDGLNSSAAATVSYTISPQNDHAPVAIANSYTLNEGALESGNIITEDTGTGVDSDADLPGDTLSIASVNGTAWAGLTDSSHATYTAGLGYKEVNTANGVVYIHQDGTTHYQHDDSETTSDSFTYTLSDGLNSSAAATVSYTISPQNDHAPVAIANSYTLNEGALESGNIITEDTGTGVDSDADLPGDTLSIASVNGTAWAGLTDSSHATYTAGLGYKEVNTANGVVYIHQDGTTHYQHDDSETTSDSFTYTLSDGLNSSAAATVSYTISPQNDHAPVAIANSYTLNEGALESGNIITEDTGTGVDSDADLPGDTLSIASVNGTAWAGLTDSSHATYTAGLGYKEVNTANGVVYIHQDGTTHYQHDDSETTSDSFTYTLSDGLNSSAAATVSYTISPQNDHAPVAIANSYTLNEGALESGNIITEDTGTGVDSDADLPGDTLSIASVNGTAWAGLTDSSHATYTAGLGYKEVNTANGVVYIHQDGTTHYQHDDSETTSDSFTYTLSDGLNSSAAATVSYTISPQNDHAPVAIANSYTLNEGALESGNIITEDTGTGVDSDADLPGDTLSIASVNGTAWAGLTDSSHATYTAGLGYKEVNTANGVVYIHQDGTTHYQHDDSETTSDSFTYTLSDGLNSSAAATVSYTISPQNDHAPVAIANSYTLNEGALESGNIITEDTGTGVDSDADLPGDTLSIASVNGTAWAGLTDSSHATYTAGLGYKEVNTANGVVYIHQDGTTHYQHDDSETTSDSFTYTLSDGLNSSAAATVSYTISPQNDHAPVAIANSYTLNEGALESGNIITEDTGTGVDSDADLPGDTLSIASVNGTAWAGLTDSSHATYTAGLGYKEVNTANGVVYIHQDGTTHYQHDDSETTSDSFTYTLSDGLNSSAAATVSYTISPQNDHAPVAVDDTGAVDEDATLNVIKANGVIDPNDTDLDGDMLSVSAIRTGPEAGSGTSGSVGGTTTGTYGTLTLNADGSYSYVADQAAADALAVGATANDTFTYTLSDGNGGTDQAELVLTITGTNDAPSVSNSISSSVSEDAAAYSIDLLQNASDADTSDTLSVANVLETSGHDASGVTLTGNRFDVDPNAYDYLSVGESVVLTYTYNVIDGQGGVTPTSATITISGANDAPVVSGSTTGSVTEDGTLNANGTLSISDVDTSDNPINFPDESTTPGDNGYGMFELSGSTWTYMLNNAHAAVQALDVTETLIDTHTFTASGGSTQVVTVTINGTDDAPVVSGTVSGNLSEGDPGDAPALAAGSLLISDVDTSDNPAFAAVGPTTGDSGYGRFALSGGTWTFTLDQGAVQDLDAGDTVTDSHTFVASDGTSQPVMVQITGTDDQPVVSGTTSGVVQADSATSGPIPISGTLGIADVDQDDTPVFADVPATLGAQGYGYFALSNGIWTYVPDAAALEALAPGEQRTDSMVFTATDGTTQAVTVTLLGANVAVIEADAPSAPPDAEHEDAPQPSPQTDPPPPEPVREEAVTEDPDGKGDPVGEAAAERLGIIGIVDEPVPFEPLDVTSSAVLNDRESATNPGGAVAKPGVEASHNLLTALQPAWNAPIVATEAFSLTLSPAHGERFWHDLDQLDVELDEASESQTRKVALEAEAVAGVTLSLTASFVSWVLRAGSLMMSFLSAMPLWRQVDPTPVLAAEGRGGERVDDDLDDDDEPDDRRKDDRFEDLFEQ